MNRLTDWTMTVQATSWFELLVEVRENGRLVERRTVTLEDLCHDRPLDDFVDRLHPGGIRRRSLRQVSG